MLYPAHGIAVMDKCQIDTRAFSCLRCVSGFRTEWIRAMRLSNSWCFCDAIKENRPELVQVGGQWWLSIYWHRTAPNIGKKVFCYLLVVNMAGLHHIYRWYMTLYMTYFLFLVIIYGRSIIIFEVTAIISKVINGNPTLEMEIPGWRSVRSYIKKKIQFVQIETTVSACQIATSHDVRSTSHCCYSLLHSHKYCTMPFALIVTGLLFCLSLLLQNYKKVKGGNYCPAVDLSCACNKITVYIVCVFGPLQNYGNIPIFPDF